MPQLDFSTFASQIFWLFLSYGLIYIFVSKYITPAIFAIKNEREEKISSDSQKTKEFLSEYEGIQQSIVNLRMESIEAEHKISAEHKKDFELNVQKEEAKSNRKIKKAMHNVQTALNEEVLNLEKKLDELCYVHASFIIKKLTGRKVDEETFREMR